MRLDGEKFWGKGVDLTRLDMTRHDTIFFRGAWDGLIFGDFFLEL